MRLSLVHGNGSPETTRDRGEWCASMKAVSLHNTEHGWLIQAPSHLKRNCDGFMWNCDEFMFAGHLLPVKDTAITVHTPSTTRGDYRRREHGVEGVRKVGRGVSSSKRG